MRIQTALFLQDFLKGMSIILGTLNFDYKYVSETFTQEKINKILEKAYNLGISSIDTAFYYNNTERYLGQSNCINNFKISSKANPWLNNDFSNGKFGELSLHGVNHQLTTTLSNLRVEQLDTYFLHCWDYDTPIKETLSAFDEHYRRERFCSFGVSNISPSQLITILDTCETESLNIRPQVYQGMYNLYCRDIEEIFPLLNEFDITFECYNPLAGGLLTGKWSGGSDSTSGGRFSDNPIYKSIFWNDSLVKETDFLSADISLRWLRKYSRLRESDSVIIGCSNEEHLENNVTSLNTEGNPDALSECTLSAIRDFYNKYSANQPAYYY